MRDELARRGLKIGGCKQELLKTLKRVLPDGEDDRRTSKCTVCKKAVLLKDLLEHYKSCKEENDRNSKKVEDNLQIPKYHNNYDNLKRLKSSKEAFMSEDLMKKPLKKRLKPFNTPFKENAGNLNLSSNEARVGADEVDEEDNHVLTPKGDKSGRAMESDKISIRSIPKEPIKLRLKGIGNSQYVRIDPLYEKAKKRRSANSSLSSIFHESKTNDSNALCSKVQSFNDGSPRPSDLSASSEMNGISPAVSPHSDTRKNNSNIINTNSFGEMGIGISPPSFTLSFESPISSDFWEQNVEAQRNIHGFRLVDDTSLSSDKYLHKPPATSDTRGNDVKSDPREVTPIQDPIEEDALNEVHSLANCDLDIRRCASNEKEVSVDMDKSPDATFEWEEVSKFPADFDPGLESASNDSEAPNNVENSPKKNIERGHLSESTDKSKSDAETTSSRPPEVYSCSICDKYFSSKGSLKKHSMIHSKKTTCCDVCGMEIFENKVEHHFSKFHRPVKCDVCGTNQASKVELRLHMKNKHSKVKRGLKPGRKVW